MTQHRRFIPFTASMVALSFGAITGLTLLSCSKAENSEVKSSQHPTAEPGSGRAVSGVLAEEQYVSDEDNRPTRRADRAVDSRAQQPPRKAGKRKSVAAEGMAGAALPMAPPMADAATMPMRRLEAPEPGVRAPSADWNREAYSHVSENRFISSATSPLSTFSIDVDTASYSNVRRFLNSEQKPPSGAVRIEELVNYFDYDYAEPRGDRPFSVHMEVGPAPWAPSRKLLHIGLKGKVIEDREMPERNLVFLIDVSGSMQSADKLPLLKRSFHALLDTLDEKDRVSMVVYAGASGLVLEPTPGNRKAAIREALDRLRAGGSTHGASGIELAYKTAERAFRQGGVNRVILATDGDFNVGVTSQSELVRLIERKRESGVFLTVLGFGTGNYQDSRLEMIADKGNGNYAYIDSDREAEKVLVEQASGSLVTIAQDVKIQVEMNPSQVGAYRLIGYENRVLAAEDFNDDKKDAGEIGAGHTVTALYELLTPEQAARVVQLDALKYQKTRPSGGHGSEIATVKLRYKQPGGRTSAYQDFPVRVHSDELEDTSDNFRFSASVAAFGMLLRESEYRGDASYRMVGRLARGAMGRDRAGYRQEFLGLVERARGLD